MDVFCTVWMRKRIQLFKNTWIYPIALAKSTIKLIKKVIWLTFSIFKVKLKFCLNFTVNLTWETRKQNWKTLQYVIKNSFDFFRHLKSKEHIFQSVISIVLKSRYTIYSCFQELTISILKMNYGNTEYLNADFISWRIREMIGYTKLFVITRFVKKSEIIEWVVDDGSSRIADN